MLKSAGKHRGHCRPPLSVVLLAVAVSLPSLCLAQGIPFSQRGRDRVGAKKSYPVEPNPAKAVAVATTPEAVQGPIGSSKA